jgi:hypothetical protein
VPASKNPTDVTRLGAYFSLHFPFPNFLRNKQEVADIQKNTKGASEREEKRSIPKAPPISFSHRGSMAPDPLTSWLFLEDKMFLRI